jgi:hypothetical protein
MTTYDRGPKAINDSELYEEIFDKRGVSEVTQYKTKIFNYSFKDQEISCYEHYWSHGDRFHKLSSKYYGEFRLWWVIAVFNQIPSEALLNYGDKILIPIDHTLITGEI